MDSNMYNNIIDPITKKNVKLSSKQGQSILDNYIIHLNSHNIKHNWLDRIKMKNIYTSNVKHSIVKPWNKVIKEFDHLIHTNSIVRLMLTQAIDQIPDNPFYTKDHIRSIDDLLNRLNNVLTIAPEYNKTLLVGTPFSAIVVWLMGTKSGLEAFRYPAINNIFKKILVEWSKFLNSRKSLYVLNDGKNGWKSTAAMKQLNINQYQIDPTDKYWGFKSWNDFFGRKLKQGVRPIASPNDTQLVVSACDCTVFNIQFNVKEVDRFWIKEQPYSMRDLLDNDTKYINKFKGGLVYQAFLNPFNYHRWHSPVEGVVTKAVIIPGLYFSEATFPGLDPNDQDASETYVSHIQTRALIIIKTKTLGYVAVMPIGMVEISTCIINSYIKPGYKIKKGEELGYFQFGGSTHCCIFEPGMIDKFVDGIKIGKTIKMGEPLAIGH
jgi:phosphatidylserine decarboxylase